VLLASDVAGSASSLTNQGMGRGIITVMTKNKWGMGRGIISDEEQMRE
jgi:hypothetical protein